MLNLVFIRATHSAAKLAAILVLLATLTTGGCASSTDVRTESASSESLRANPPHGWVRVYQLNSPTSRLSDFVPPGEDEENWTTRLSFESFPAKGLGDPIELLLAEATQDQGRCDFVQHFNLFSGLENNYPASVRLFYCGTNAFSGDGEVKLVKAITGNDYVYFIRFLKHIPPFKPNSPGIDAEEVASWSTYVRSITLCDSRLPAHACNPP